MTTTAPMRYALGLAYQHGRDPLIKAGLDEALDFITEAELEKAAHAFLAKGQPVVNLFHSDLLHSVNTDGHATVVESYIYRGPNWPAKDTFGRDVVIKSGDWMIGAIFDEVAWDLVERGLIGGWSPQGVGTRRTKKTTSVAKSDRDHVTDALTLARAGYSYADLAAALAARTQLIKAA